MTEAMVDDALVEVTPEDREAAIRHLERTGRSREELCGAKIRSGEWDHTEDVQAFARHRLAGVAAGREEAAHSDDVAVDRFAEQMKAKLATAREKGRGGWDDPAQCSTDYLRQLLHEHVAKGDPVDVANFCMMLSHYGASTATTPVDDPAMEGAVAKAVRDSLRSICGVELKPSTSRKVAEDVLSAVRQRGE